MPEEGAAGTSGAVRGSASGGKAVWTAAPRAGAPRPVPTRATLGAAVPGRGAMADVDRRAVGLRPALLLPLPVSLPLPAEESCRSRVMSPLIDRSPFSAVLLGCRAEVGVGVLELVVAKEACEADSWEADSAAEAGAEPTAAEDCERWRMESSEGLRRRSWDLLERWPGVCDRGIGGARSRASLASSKRSAEDRVSTGDWADGAIRCERTTFDFDGDDGARSRPDIPGPPPLALAWSAIVGSYDHVSDVNNGEPGGENAKKLNSVAQRSRKGVQREIGVRQDRMESKIRKRKRAENQKRKKGMDRKVVACLSQGKRCLGGKPSIQQMSGPTFAATTEPATRQTALLQCYCGASHPATPFPPHHHPVNRKASTEHVQIDLLLELPESKLLSQQQQHHPRRFPHRILTKSHTSCQDTTMMLAKICCPSLGTPPLRA
jgi:hypothetical protein